MTLESRFADETSCHGVRHVFYAANIIARILWILCILGSLGFFIWQFHSLMSSYMKYEAVTEVTVKTHPAVPFPALTICNYNRLKKSVLEQYAERYNLPAVQIWQYLILAMNIHVSMSLSGPGSPKPQNLSMHSKATSDRIRQVDGAIDLEGMIRNASFSVYELFAATSFAEKYTKKLIDDMMSGVFTSSGVCVTFNPREESSLVQGAVGLTSGLFTGLRTNSQENSENVTDYLGGNFAVGFQIMVHQHGTWPSLVPAVSISPGKQAFVSIEKMVYENAGKPWGECVTRQLKYFQVYTEESCRTECLIEYLHQQCNCHPIVYPRNVSDNVSLCLAEDMVSCVISKSESYKNQESSCTSNCKVACKYEEYRVSVSDAGTGEDGPSKTLAIMLNMTVEQFTKDYALVNVYLKELKSLHFVQKEGKTFSDLVADIGGQLGLAMGISLITLAEFIIYFVNFIGRMVTSKSKQNQVREMEKPPLD